MTVNVDTPTFWVGDSMPIHTFGIAQSVQYTVTEQHMCQLARIQHLGSLETCLGHAKFLLAIAPLVWPGLKLELGAQTVDPKGAEPSVVLKVAQ